MAAGAPYPPPASGLADCGGWRELQNSPLLRNGTPVKEGQVVGLVGMMKTDHMLHFELYSGQGTTNLMRSKSGPYQRREDLIDPTSLLDRLAAELLGRKGKS